MARLRDLARMIRSKNAGPFHLTIDFLFDDEPTYLRVCASGVLSRESVARIYSMDEADVHLVHYDPAYAIKITIPRFVVSGSPGDTDVFGGQQHAPFVDLEIPDANATGAVVSPGTCQA